MSNLKKDLYIVVGAGGTGSYFIPNLISYLNSLPSKFTKRVVIVDGDVVEEKNLLRQGFYGEELDLGKAEAIVNRLSEYTFDKVEFSHLNKFINSVSDLVEIAKDGHTENFTNLYNEIHVISCVDNNMARLRMTFGIYALREIFKKKVSFIDSGNSEWNGQTLATLLLGRGSSYLDNLYEITESMLSVNEYGLKVIDTELIHNYKNLLNYEMNDTHANHIYSGIFTQMDGWINKLNKADFEQSCEDVVVSNPQNIGTNMMASNLLLLRLASIHRNEYKGGELQFDASTNTFKTFDYENGVEEGYSERLQEMVDYIKTPIGFLEVFTDYILVENGELPEVHSLLENLYNEHFNKDKKEIVDKDTLKEEDSLLEELELEESKEVVELEESKEVVESKEELELEESKEVVESKEELELEKSNEVVEMVEDILDVELDLDDLDFMENDSVEINDNNVSKSNDDMNIEDIDFSELEIEDVENKESEELEENNNDELIDSTDDVFFDNLDDILNFDSSSDVLDDENEDELLNFLSDIIND